MLNGDISQVGKILSFEDIIFATIFFSSLLIDLKRGNFQSHGRSSFKIRIGRNLRTIDFNASGGAINK